MSPQIIPMSHPNKISNIIWDQNLEAPAGYEINANNLTFVESYIDEISTNSVYTIPYTQTTSIEEFMNTYSADKLIGQNIDDNIPCVIRDCTNRKIKSVYTVNTKRKITVTLTGKGQDRIDFFTQATLRNGEVITIVNKNVSPMTGGSGSYIENWNNPIISLTGSWYSNYNDINIKNKVTWYLHTST